MVSHLRPTKNDLSFTWVLLSFHLFFIFHLYPFLSCSLHLYLAPEFFYLFFNLFSSFILSHFLSFTWILFYLSSQFFFIFLLNFFYLPPYFFHLSPETRKSKSPSAAAVHCCRHSTKIKMLMIIIDQWWWSWYHFTLTLFKMIVVRGSWRLTWSGSPPQFTFVSEQVGWGGPWLGVTWSSRDLGRCPAVLRADVRIECNFDFGGL